MLKVSTSLNRHVAGFLHGRSLTGCNTVEEAVRLCDEISSILNSGGFTYKMGFKPQRVLIMQAIDPLAILKLGK
ncbi:hypothetical protein JTB14_024031 [Gonioctena quinquepunctata]|nr:hypothetical protein JTB14_024031 [Gonioctena quinquepunctata]